MIFYKYLGSENLYLEVTRLTTTLNSQVESNQFRATSKPASPNSSASGGAFQDPTACLRPTRGDWLAIPAIELTPTPATGDWLAIPANQLARLPSRNGDWLAIPAQELATPIPLGSAPAPPPPCKTLSADAEPATALEGGLPGFPGEGGARKRPQNRCRGGMPEGKDGKIGQAKSEGDLMGDRPCQVSLTADGTLVNLVPAI